MINFYTEGMVNRSSGLFAEDNRDKQLMFLFCLCCLNSALYLNLERNYAYLGVEMVSSEARLYLDE